MCVKFVYYIQKSGNVSYMLCFHFFAKRSARSPSRHILKKTSLADKHRLPIRSYSYVPWLAKRFRRKINTFSCVIKYISPFSFYSFYVFQMEISFRLKKNRNCVLGNASRKNQDMIKNEYMEHIYIIAHPRWCLTYTEFIHIFKYMIFLLKII